MLKLCVLESLHQEFILKGVLVRAIHLLASFDGEDRDQCPCRSDFLNTRKDNERDRETVRERERKRRAE